MEILVSIVLHGGICSFIRGEKTSVSSALQAQLCLASVYSQERNRDERKSVHYLKMAAESGVSGLLDDSTVLSLGLSILIIQH